MNKTLHCLRGMALAAAAMLPISGGAASAQGDLDIAIIGADLVNRALMYVTVEYRCEANLTGATLNVSVTQAAGNRIARGYSQVQATCTGQIETAEVPILPADEVPFHGGKAVISATIDVCDPFCRWVTDGPEIVQLR